MRTRVGKLGGPGPFEFVILPFLFFGGLTTLTNFGTPTSINRVLPDELLLVWSIMLILGGAIGFTGVVWWGREATALIIEQIGVVLIAGASTIYAIALISQIDSVKGASVVTSFVGGCGVASVWRVIQITKAQRRMVALSEFLDDSEDE